MSKSQNGSTGSSDTMLQLARIFRENDVPSFFGREETSTFRASDGVNHTLFRGSPNDLEARRFMDQGEP